MTKEQINVTFYYEDNNGPIPFKFNTGYKTIN